jgi:hypothetical protein
VLVDELVARAEDGALLDAMERHYEALRADPSAWELHKAEIASWDATVSDGLVQS